jgi:predicted DNA-binding protein
MKTDKKFQVRVTESFEETLLRLQAAARATEDTAARIVRIAIREKVEEIAGQYPEKFEAELRKLAA